MGCFIPTLMFVLLCCMIIPSIVLYVLNYQRLSNFGWFEASIFLEVCDVFRKEVCFMELRILRHPLRGEEIVAALLFSWCFFWHGTASDADLSTLQHTGLRWC